MSPAPPGTPAPAPAGSLAVDDERRAVLLRERTPRPAEPQFAALDRRRIGKERQRRHDFDASRRYTALRDAGFSHRAGAPRRRRVGFPRPLTRGFWYGRMDGAIRPTADRGEVAARLGGRASLPHAEPRPGEGRTSATGTSWRCCRTRRGRCTWGTSSTTRWATSRRTCGDARAGACCGRWASTRSACLPRTRPSARAAIRARSRSATSSSSASR